MTMTPDTEKLKALDDIEKLRAASEHYLFLIPAIEEIDRLRAALKAQGTFNEARAFIAAHMEKEGAVLAAAEIRALFRPTPAKET